MTLVVNQIEEVEKSDRSVLLVEQNKNKKVSYLSLSLACNRTLPNIKTIR